MAFGMKWIWTCDGSFHALWILGRYERQVKLWSINVTVCAHFNFSSELLSFAFDLTLCFDLLSS